ncbi:MAG: chromate efflux transporter [Alphaproteobacteria bacterium]|nr:chromate efflux transporter [Alphaproteobacteria bacterium]
MTAPSFRELQNVFARIGLLSFGGPAGQIALIHREVVEERHWIEEQEFLHALSFCTLLPGPEAMQLATYIGWKLQGLRGGLAAGLLFILPGAAVIYALSLLYALFGKLKLIEGLFWGVKAAVLVIVLEALLRVAKRALKTNLDWLVAGASFLSLFCFDLPFPLVVMVAGLLGYAFASTAHENTGSTDWPPLGNLVKSAIIWLTIWLVPLGAIALIFGSSHVFTSLAVFFSKLSVVTFGGAYAVLSYMGQTAVEHYHWLTTGEMMDGLGLAETTPGPLILVGQFVAFTAAAKSLNSLQAGFFASLIYLWMTFVPCFLWIFAGAPYVQVLRTMPRLASALARITAAVAGVILNLTVWFGLHVLFGQVARAKGPVPLWWPNWQSLDSGALVLAIIAGLALLKFKIGIPKTLALAAGLSVIWELIRPLI